MDNYTPYEMHILLQLHVGMEVTADARLGLYHETMSSFVDDRLATRTGPGARDYVAGPALADIMRYVLSVPRPSARAPRRPMTQRQAQVLEFIKGWIHARSLPPTTREIAKHFGFRSITAAQDHLFALERKQYIKTGLARARGIEILP